MWREQQDIRQLALPSPKFIAGGSRRWGLTVPSEPEGERRDTGGAPRRAKRSTVRAGIGQDASRCTPRIYDAAHGEGTRAGTCGRGSGCSCY